MIVERSKRRSHFLLLVFITKCFNKNLILRIMIKTMIIIMIMIMIIMYNQTSLKNKTRMLHVYGKKKLFLESQYHH